jgi:hypothetical protein
VSEACHRKNSQLSLAIPVTGTLCNPPQTRYPYGKPTPGYADGDHSVANASSKLMSASDIAEVKCWFLLGRRDIVVGVPLARLDFLSIGGFSSTFSKITWEQGNVTEGRGDVQTITRALHTSSFELM